MAASDSPAETTEAEPAAASYPAAGAEPREADTTSVDSTDHTLAYLRILRRKQHREDAKSTLYAIYCVVIMCAVWVVPYLVAAARAAQEGGPDGELAQRAVAALPASLTALLAMVMLSAARTARWRGPVRLDEAAVSWLLPHPVRRAALLLPSLRRSALFSLSAGTAIGGMAGFALQALTEGAWWTTTLAGLWAGAVTGLSCTSLGALVQRHQERLTGHAARWFTVAGCGVLLLTLLAGAAVVWQNPALSWVLLFSGPWGWALMPLAAAAGLAGGWAVLVGTGLSSALLAVAAPLALRTAPAVPARVLRLHALLSFKATAALYAMDVRGARAVARSVSARRTWRTLRLPPPQRRWLLVPWRDLTALLRSPSQLVSALVWALGSAMLLRLSAAVTGELSVLVMFLALTSCYTAASRAAVGARLDGEDRRRSDGLPWPPAALALRHAVVPCALVAVEVLGGVMACAALWGSVPGGALLLAGVPTFVVAALITAYRGDVPPHMLIGTDTAMGNTSALNVLMWRGRGPLVVIGFAAPAYLMPSATAMALGWLALVTVASGWWAYRVAARTT